jgi:IS605 OrfB family transposase
MAINRVKQLASRIVEAALGVGKEQEKIGKKEQKRSVNKIFEPCHAVVIENLTHYRPEETRTRRENRQLMIWSSSKVKKYLAESCELNGLHLREVQADYTSRQDSRTGAAGMRCQDVPVADFMQSSFWRKQVVRANKKRAQDTDARERFLCDLNAKWKESSESEWKNAGIIRIPLKGGEIFVSADQNSPVSKGIQADINAAANIGLKSLIDPDWEGKWWYIPCSPQGVPKKDKVKGSLVIDLNKSLLPQNKRNVSEIGKKKRGGSNVGMEQGQQSDKDTVINYWHDLSPVPLQGRDWVKYASYWKDVEEKVIKILRNQAGLSV